MAHEAQKGLAAQRRAGVGAIRMQLVTRLRAHRRAPVAAIRRVGSPAPDPAAAVRRAAVNAAARRR